MYIVKWVETDDVFNYHPSVRFAESYEDAIEIKNLIIDKFDSQEFEPELLDSGKVVSDPIIEEIKFNKNSNHRIFYVDEKQFCKKCGKSANRIVAKTDIEIEMVWNEDLTFYEVAEEIYYLENATSVQCTECLSNMLKQD